MTTTNLVYNQNTIIRLLKYSSNKILNIFILKINKKTIYIAKKAKEINIKILYIKNIKNNNFDYIKKYNSVICEIKNCEINTYQLEELITLKETKKILILDRIQDPYNFAACIRTAEAFSFDTIITNEKNSIKNSSLLNKISNGANLFTKILIKKNLIPEIKILKKYKFKILGLSSKTKNLDKIELNTPIAIIVGSEKNGINKSILNECTDLYTIKMSEKCKNINVSVTTGIILSKIQD